MSLTASFAVEQFGLNTLRQLCDIELELDGQEAAVAAKERRIVLAIVSPRGEATLKALTLDKDAPDFLTAVRRAVARHGWPGNATAALIYNPATGELAEFGAVIRAPRHAARSLLARGGSRTAPARRRIAAAA